MESVFRCPVGRPLPRNGRRRRRSSMKGHSEVDHPLGLVGLCRSCVDFRRFWPADGDKAVGAQFPD